MTRNDREMHGSSSLKPMIAMFAAGLVVTSFVACGDPPTRPAPPVTNGPVFIPPVLIVRLEVSAPSRVAPGESVQLTANAVKSDGSVDNVTGLTVWSSSNPGAVEVSDTGVARGIASGEAAIFGRFGGRVATTQTLVVPQGTYRLTGRTLVDGFAISEVLLTVVSGTGSGLTAVSGSDGGYALYGVSGPIRIQAKRDGFANRTESLDVANNRAFDLGLEVDGRAPDIEGTYTLTVAAAPCLWRQAVLPEEARSRSYTAQLTQQGAGLDVTLSGADFIVTGGRGNRFAGFVEPSGAVTFDIVGDLDMTNDPYYAFAEHDVAERFGTGRALLVSGRVTAKATGPGIFGALDGWISVGVGVKPPFEPAYPAVCRASDHRFELRRR